MPPAPPVTEPPPPPPGTEWDPVRAQIGRGMLSVVMPAHNLGATIAANIREVHALLLHQVDFEIVVVDDGSTDDTAARLRAVADGLPRVRPVLLPTNVGKGAALKKGFEASRGDHVLLLDADLDLSPAQLPRFFEVMARTDASIVIGSKLHPESVSNYPWHRRIVSYVYYRLVKALFGLPVRDTQTGMKLFRRDALAWVFPRLLVKRFAFDLELLAAAHGHGFPIAECPVRLNVKSQWGCVAPAAVRQVLLDTLAVFYRIRLLDYYERITHLAPPDPLPMLSVIVACPAPSTYLEECLAGLRRQDYPALETIVLPDFASGRAWGPGIREIPTGRVRPAEKRNLGAKVARGELLAFLDDDAAPLPDWARNAVPYFADPGIGGVGGPGITPVSDGFWAAMSGRVYASRLVSGGYRYRYVPDHVRSVDDFPSCNLLIRRSAFNDLGGFRTDYWPGEDTILCMDLTHKLRLRLMYDPRVVVEHHRRALFLPHLRQVGRYAMHRGHFARRFPATSRRIAYMLPSAFVLGLVLGGLLAALVPLLRVPYVSVVTVYLALTGLFSLSTRPTAWLVTWLGIMATHIVYGLGFLAGCAAPSMRRTVAGFDHPSEHPAPSAAP